MRNKVVIIGAGLMGSGIAAVSALSGNMTILVEKNNELSARGIKNAGGNIRELCENGLAEDAAAGKAYGLLSAGEDMAKACEEAFIVIEAIVENLEAKKEIFSRLDSLLPAEVPILSNTSGLRITDIASDTVHPERTMTAHFWFPAHLVPLVEVVMSERTDIDMAQKVKSMLADWGKKPVLVRRDVPGQLANRILQAVIREATSIVETGLASPEDVDTAVKAGMGIRFPVWGPLEHIDAVGLDLGLSVQQTVLPDINNEDKPVESLKKLVDEGNLGYKTGKGYYDWSEKDMEGLAALRNDFIIYALKMLKQRN
jgi:3-hydroxyacyl-CoA dehydrogenase